MNKEVIPAIIATMVCLLTGSILTIKGYVLVRDVDALVDRAQVAANSDDMTEYMTELKKNLERHNMTHGHFALIFETPANDLALNFKAINRILARLQSIKDLPKNGTAYQVALDDIRGTIRELPNPAMGYLFAKYWFLFLLIPGIWLWPAIIIFKDRY